MASEPKKDRFCGAMAVVAGGLGSAGRLHRSLETVPENQSKQILSFVHRIYLSKAGPGRVRRVSMYTCFIAHGHMRREHGFSLCFSKAWVQHTSPIPHIWSNMIPLRSEAHEGKPLLDQGSFGGELRRANNPPIKLQKEVRLSRHQLGGFLSCMVSSYRLN